MYRSACIAFFLAGFVLACWSPLIPLLKLHLALSDGQMGLVLLFFGVGSLIAMPGAGHLAGLFGCRRVLSVSVPGAVISVCLLAFSHNIYLLSSLVLMFGIFIGATDVVVNVNAALVQKILDRPIMSSMHGLFSLGAFAGSGTVSLGLYSGMSIEILFLAIVLMVILVFVLIAQEVSDTAEKESSVAFSLPSRSIIMLGFGCCMAYLIEGAMLDWSGIFLMAQSHVSLRLAGFAFTSFSVAMMVGRLLGDQGVRTLGSGYMFGLSAFLLLVGLVCVLSVSSFVMCLCALFLVGLGLANIAPIIFTFTAQAQPNAVARSISQVSTMGYAGILLGPACIGGVASLSSIKGAFGFITVMALPLCLRSLVHLRSENNVR